jgi:hypothetical protein
MLKQFNSNARKLNRIIPKINLNNLVSLDLTGSILNIEYTDGLKFDANTRQKPISKNIINNNTKIANFHKEILKYSINGIPKKIDSFDANNNTLTLLNTKLKYGTDGTTTDDFEILVYGLHIPTNYSITELNDDIIIKLNADYIDYSEVTIDDIYVVGKFL